MKKIFFALACLIVLVPFAGNTAQAKCDPNFINPISEIDWTGVWPIRFAGAVISPSPPYRKSIISQPICSCDDGAEQRVGVTVGFWEPVLLADVVKDPMCFAGMGLNMKDDEDLWGGGGMGTSLGKNRESEKYFANAHLYWYPAWTIMEILIDFTCTTKTPFDIAWISEVSPLWNDDMLSMMINPEAALFANPISQATCMADCMSSTAGFPMDSMFWCAGCQGTMYPATGHTSIEGDQSVGASFHVMEKMLYKMHRQMTLWGYSGKAALCGSYPMPVIKKSQYKVQPMRPKNKKNVFPLGRPQLLWGAGVNPPVPSKADNFSYLLFRNRDCCAF